MAYIDLGNPVGFVVSGMGAERIAGDVGGVVSYVDPGEYQAWVHETQCGQIAPECGALALASTHDADVAHIQRHDDYGQVLGSNAGGGSF